MADWITVSTERPGRGPATTGHGVGTRGGRLASWLQRGVLVSLIAAAACATHTRGSVPPGTDEPDKFLFERGTEALNNKKWLTAREFFKQVTETYTQSPYRPDAKLGIGDTYLGEGTAEALVLAINEFREFLSFYPTNRRADYAQFKVGMSHFRQMRAAQRDQTETREAIKEFEAFVARYPDSSLMSEGKAKLREARDRLSESDYLVGYFYFRQRWYPGAIDRFRSLLRDDPEYTGRDAVFYHLAESLARTKREAEALPMFERLVQEFEQSEYLPLAQKRITELKTTLTLTKTSGG
jgi:outer membrane protein assembly factor BamD